VGKGHILNRKHCLELKESRSFATTFGILWLRFKLLFSFVMSGEIEDSYSGDSFFDDEPTSSKRDEDSNLISIGKQDEPKSPPSGHHERITTVESMEEYSEVSSPPPDAVAKSCMSTIEEESRSYDTSTAASVSYSRRVAQEQVASSEEDFLKSNKAQSQ
ncbi:hypothetical protein Ocin01_02181, partial [Orchesella cincta]